MLRGHTDGDYSADYGQEDDLTETGEEDNLADETAIPHPQADGPDDPRRTFLRQWLAINEPGLRTALRPMPAPWPRPAE